jgi:hypothetical protein
MLELAAVFAFLEVTRQRAVLPGRSPSQLEWPRSVELRVPALASLAVLHLWELEVRW